MGSDDLHSKRKAKQAKGRAAARKQPYDKVLIVCEGGKTEYNYFKNFTRVHDIHSANVTIHGIGCDPVSVVRYGVDLYEQEKQTRDPFDRVYCVFDRDSFHLQGQKYQQALDILKKKELKATFFAANSVPCFEYWLLLHFVDCRKQFASKGNKSVGDVVKAELKKYWPEYEKNIPEPYSYLCKKLGKRLAKSCYRYPCKERP